MAAPSTLRIVIPGGSGQVGQILARHFHAKGHTVRILARHVRPGPWWTTLWDGRQIGSWAKELDGADLVVNLAGSTVNSRYTEANRRAIKESRVRTTELIGQAIAQASRPPALWINASTATIYRHALDRPMDEATGEIGGNEPKTPSSWRFSIDVATSWERAFFDAPTPITRKIAIRSSMVLSPDKGGVFDVLSRSGTQGSGRNRRARKSILLLDRRPRFSASHRIPDRQRKTRRSNQHLLAKPNTKSRVHARATQSMGSLRRAPHRKLDASHRSHLHANRNRVNPQKPPGNPRTPVERRVRIPTSRLAIRRSRSRAPLARTPRSDRREIVSIGKLRFSAP